MTDFRALCAELHAAFNTYAVDEAHHDLLVRARAALAQPEPQGPTDEELMAVFWEHENGLEELWSHDWPAAARAVLARWGNHPESPDSSDGPVVPEGTDLRSLDEHNRFALAANSLFMVTKPNGIACPKCGHELLDSNSTVCLTSSPPQYNTHCPACDYRGYRY